MCAHVLFVFVWECYQLFVSVHLCTIVVICVSVYVCFGCICNNVWAVVCGGVGISVHVSV